MMFKCANCFFLSSTLSIWQNRKHAVFFTSTDFFFRYKIYIKLFLMLFIFSKHQLCATLYINHKYDKTIVWNSSWATKIDNDRRRQQKKKRQETNCYLNTTENFSLNMRTEGKRWIFNTEKVFADKTRFESAS